MKDLSRIYDSWLDLWNKKEAFAFGDEEVDLEPFKALVKDTYYLIVEMHEHIASGDYSNIKPDEMREYLDLVSVMSLYAANMYTDESEGNTFAVTRLLTFSLADYGANYSYYVEDEDDPVESGDGLIVTIDGFSYGIERELRYDVNKGDFSDFIEFASVVGC